MWDHHHACWYQILLHVRRSLQTVKPSPCNTVDGRTTNGVSSGCKPSGTPPPPPPTRSDQSSDDYDSSSDTDPNEEGPAAAGHAMDGSDDEQSDSLPLLVEPSTDTDSSTDTTTIDSDSDTEDEETSPSDDSGPVFAPPNQSVTYYVSSISIIIPIPIHICCPRNSGHMLGVS